MNQNSRAVGAEPVATCVQQATEPNANARAMELRCAMYKLSCAEKKERYALSKWTTKIKKMPPKNHCKPPIIFFKTREKNPAGAAGVATSGQFSAGKSRQNNNQLQRQTSIKMEARVAAFGWFETTAMIRARTACFAWLWNLVGFRGDFEADAVDILGTRKSHDSPFGRRKARSVGERANALRFLVRGWQWDAGGRRTLARSTPPLSSPTRRGPRHPCPYSLDVKQREARLES